MATEFELGLGVFGEPTSYGGGSGSTDSLTTRTASSNIGASGQIAQLAQMVNSINQRAQQASNAGRIPGGAGLESISSGNINRALRGQLDPSVINQNGQAAAERGVMTGSPDGPGSSAAYLRALGLNTMDLMNTGQNWLTQATNRNPGAPLFDPSSMFLSPSQFGALEMERARLPRGGGGTSFSASPGMASPRIPLASQGMGINWEDLFGGDNRGLSYSTPIDSFPYGTGAGTDDSSMIYSGEDPNNFGVIPVGSSIGGGTGLFEDAFAGL